MGKGPNDMGTTAVKVEDYGFMGMTSNSGDRDVAQPKGTTGVTDPGGVENAVYVPTDTTMMAVPEGTVNMVNRWGI